MDVPFSNRFFQSSRVNQQRPIYLLAIAAGVEIVEDHLERLEYSVYA